MYHVLLLFTKTILDIYAFYVILLVSLVIVLLQANVLHVVQLIPIFMTQILMDLELVNQVALLKHTLFQLIFV